MARVVARSSDHTLPFSDLKSFFFSTQGGRSFYRGIFLKLVKRVDWPDRWCRRDEGLKPPARYPIFSLVGGAPSAGESRQM